MNPAVPKIAAGVIAAGAVVALAVALLTGDDTFRNILVDSFNGSSAITRNAGDLVEPYRGLQLADGDDVQVASDGDMTLAVDDDKHLYAEGGTHFWLEAAGSAGDTQTKISMDSSATLHRLENKLGDSESYQVETPTATMSVRGTVFRVQIYEDDDDVYTLVEVFEGRVDISLIGPDGKPNGKQASFAAGEAALIRANSEFTEFVLTDEVDDLVWEAADGTAVKASSGGTGVEQHVIPYKKLPEDAAEVLVSWIDDGAELCIGRDLLRDYTGLTDHRYTEKVLTPATTTEEGEGVYVCEVCGEEGDHYPIPKLDSDGETNGDAPGKRDSADGRSGNGDQGSGGHGGTRPSGGSANSFPSRPSGTHSPGTHQPSGKPSSHDTTQSPVTDTSTPENSTSTEHEHTIVTDAAVAATCTKAGLTKGKHCSECGEVIVKQKKVAALGHKWGRPTFTWNDDLTCTATFKCRNDDSHVKTLATKVTSTVRTEATCTSAETSKLTATVKLSGKTYTSTKIAKTSAKLGHNWGKPSITWNEDGTATVTSKCARDADHVDTANATVTSQVTREATCTESEITSYTATGTAGNQKASATRETESGVALGHSWGEPSFEWADDAGSCTATRACTRDASHSETVAATVTSEVTTAATHLAKGTTTYTATATFDDVSYTSTKALENIPTVAHTYATYGTAVAPTCDTAGSTTGSWCPECGTVFSTGTTIPALGHDWDNGKIVFTWTAPISSDGTYGSPTCTATRTCTRDSGHTETVNAEVTTSSDAQTAAKYTASVTFDGTSYFDGPYTLNEIEQKQPGTNP